ncbi:MAG: hypothetical protein CMC35_08145 [Flavobacteriaceae bacterium]|nr:hypothetical protein [Flavobacteriaceae bacterium]|tara:strand:+ start:20217 stop:20888 length:672 start_codon:yes stop_codon:yes gene_type:complete
MISKEGQFIFIHNFKTGGTSIEKKLGHFEELARDVQDHRTLRDIELLTRRDKHLRTAAYCLKKGKFGKIAGHLQQAIHPPLTRHEYDTFYKFTFVRNSWARIYSWYANVMKDDIHKRKNKIQSNELSFEAFLKHHINHETFSQLHFITDCHGEVPMDFIGRFERLQADFDIVCKELGVEDSTLPKLLVRKYNHYTDGYTDTTKDLVYQLYKKEIDYFGFEFGE